jgi:hypothetical protein
MTEPAPKTSKKPAISYEQVMAKARSLCDQQKLTTSWIHEKLEVEGKKPADYSESDLKPLNAELDEFIAAYEAANPTPKK